MRYGVLLLAALACASPAAAQDIPARLSLSEALRLALARNPSVLSTREGVAAAEADRLGASLRPNPAFTFETVGKSFLQPSPRPDAHELAVRIDQEIEMGGRRRLRREVAELGIGVAEARYADARRRLELDVRRAYFTLALATAQRQVAADAIGEIDRVIQLNRARLQQGEISGGELRRIQVERLRFQDDVFASELAVRNARGALLTLMNAPDLGAAVEAADGFGPPDADITAAIAIAASLRGGGLVSDPVAQRPDVVAARGLEQQAGTQTRLQRALSRPSPTVGGGLRHDSGFNSAIVGVTIPLPLFNRNQGAVARAEAERRQLVLLQTAIERDAALDIQQALNAVDVNQERVAYIERETLTNARESRDVVLASYRLGAANLIDFLDAQRAFRDTLRTYNDALFQQRVSLAQLAAAVGGPARPPQ